MSECTHDCSSCGESCSSRTSPQSFLEKPHEQSNIKKVIGVVSGKGGVGKSLVTSLLASAVQKKGLQSGILDGDITGPSIPKMFGATRPALGSEDGILPVEAANGTKLISLNNLMQNEDDPVIWRGSLIASAVKQFWTDVMWGDVDVLLVDMPPGTGDVPLTVFQSLPLDGIVVVASPQDLVSMIVGKAVKMAEMMNIPVLALVENMSYFQCPDCGKKHFIYGESHIDELAAKHGISTVCRIPIDPAFAKACDEGRVFDIEADFLKELTDTL